MKKLLLLISILALFAVCLIGCGCNNDGEELSLTIEYELTDDKAGYKVIGISSNYSDTPLSEVVIPSKYNDLDVVEIESVSNAKDFLGKITLPDTIRVIREKAFLNCSKLSSVNIPSSVSFIGEGAFKNCSSITSVTIPNSVTVVNKDLFNGCTKLYDINIHSQVVEIQDYAFAGTGLESFIIPDTVLKLGEGIFQTCQSLKTATLPNHLTYIPASTFSKCTALKTVNFNEEIVTKFEVASFLGCNILRDMSLDNIVKIEKDALLGCTLMTEKFDGIYYAGHWIVNIDNEQVIDKIVIDDHVIGISDGALYGGLMSELVIPDSVVYLGNEALANLPNLKSIQIGKGVSHIGEMLLYNCPSLELITVSEENLTIKSVDNCIYSKDDKTLLKYNTGSKQEAFTVLDRVEVIGKYAFAYSSLKEISLPIGLKSILEGGFENCLSLNKISLPQSLSEIMEKSFYNCISLEEITIPAGITEIPYSLFYQCEKLKSVTINGQITKIDNFSFEKCKSLESIIIPDTTQYIGIGAFRDCISLKSISIPKNVAKIDEFAFMNTKSLGEIKVDSKNESYIANNGVLYTSDMKELVQYPIANREGSFTLPSGVLVICGGAFAGNEHLTEIKLNDSIELIKARAFSYCTQIKEITIPKTIKAVYANAFEYSGLERINVEREEPSYDEDNWSPYWSIYTDAIIVWKK